MNQNQKIIFNCLINAMSRLKTNAKKKLNKALTRVEKVVIMDVRRNLEQQKKWKAKVMNKKSK
jgi:hypothetical protein